MRLDVKQGPHYELEGCSHLHLLTEGKEFLDLGSQLRLQLQQMLVADRVALGGIGTLVPSRLIVPNFSTPASWASKSTWTERSFSSGRNVRLDEV